MLNSIQKKLSKKFLLNKITFYKPEHYLLIKLDQEFPVNAIQLSLVEYQLEQLLIISKQHSNNITQLKLKSLEKTKEIQEALVLLDLQHQMIKLKQLLRIELFNSMDLKALLDLLGEILMHHQGAAEGLKEGELHAQIIKPKPHHNNTKSQLNKIIFYLCFYMFYGSLLIYFHRY